MMVEIEKINELYVKIKCDRGVAQELSEYFKFPVEGAKYTPAYKAKMWDGYIRLFNMNTHKIYSGLVRYIREFCRVNNYQLVENGHLETNNNIDLSITKDFIDSLQLSSKGSLIGIRDYQVEAVHKIINNNRAVLLAATSSGKSAIIYSLIRHFLTKDMKCLILVPNTSLVSQLYSDFQDYSGISQWSVEDNCQKLYSGLDKEFTRKCLITTWQSILAMLKSKEIGKPFLNQFDMVLFDEAHLSKSKCLIDILECTTNTKYRIGTTGTLDNCTANIMQIEGLLGPVHKVVTTKELIDNNMATQLDITCLLLDYDDETKKTVSKMLYQDEMDFLVTNFNRNKFIANLTKAQKGNTLVLFQYVEKHGKVLYNMIQDRVGNTRKLYFISGEVKPDERERIRLAIEHDVDAIIVASFATCSTGLNIPSIENIIFSSPTKSKIRNLQSIGRGLRLKKGKNICNLYDIGDNLAHKKKKNFTLQHLSERIKQYSAEGFTYKVVNIKL